MPFSIVRNDITKMETDAIVNTANPEPLYGSGIDKAIYEAAGPYNLLKKRQEIGKVEPGNSFITEGFNLHAKYIIHTVGTKWRGGEEGEEETIRKCYKGIFKLAKENGIESLSIPLLATGNNGFPKKLALKIAISEIEEFLMTSDIVLYLVVFDDESYSVSNEFYKDIDSYINENYIEEKVNSEYAENGSEKNNSKSSSGSSSKDKKTKLKKENNFEQDKESKHIQNKERKLEDVIGNLDKTFMEMVFSFADFKEISDVEVQRRANIDRKAFSKLKCGTTKRPSKSTAFALAIALKLNLDQTVDLLARAGYAFSPCDKQDIIVKYFIEKEIYDIYEINFALFEHGQQELGAKL